MAVRLVPPVSAEPENRCAGVVEREPENRRAWVVEREHEGVWREIGSVGYVTDHHGGAELAVRVAPGAGGGPVAGLARGLARAVGLAFDADGVRALTWRAEVGDWAARRAVRQVGFPVPQSVPALLPATATAPAREGWIATLRHDDPRRPAHPWLDIPVLSGADVVLRPWRDTDHAAVLDLDDEARTYVGPALPPTEHGAYRVWVRRGRESAAAGTALTWCIADDGTDRPLGWLGLFDLADRHSRGTGQVGYWLRPEARGRGAVTQALGLVREHAFGPLGLHRLWATTDERNAASQAALLRAGFRWVATEAQASALTEEQRADRPLFELLADTDDRAGPRPAAPPVVSAVEGAVAAVTGAARVPRLEDGQVRLRPWRQQDAPRIDEACTDPVTRRFLPDLPEDYGTGEALAYIQTMHRLAAEGTQLGWCVADPETDRCLGAMALSELTAREAMVGYWAHPDARGRGVATTALRLVLRHALTPSDEGGMGLARVYLRAAAGNPPSQRVARAAGMTQVGRDRGAQVLRDGTVQDLLRFDVLAAELPGWDAAAPSADRQVDPS